LSYRIPYIDRKQKQGLIFDINYSEPVNAAYRTEDHKLVFLESNKSVKVSKSASVSYTYRRSFYETHSLSAGYSDNSVIDTINYLNPNYYGGKTRLRFATLSYSFNSEHRDVIQYPLKGYQITGFAQKVGLGVGDHTNQWELNLTYAYHLPLGRDYYFSNFTSAYLSAPNEQPYVFFGALGYRKQFVRGYEIYLIEGPKFFLNKTTFKKKIFSRVWQFDDVPLKQFQYFPVSLYFKSYIDLGYVENYPYYNELNINTRLSDRLLGSIGAGLDLILLYDTVFRFEYTFTRENVHGFFFNVRKEF
jgi:Outer membrane protein/protective antigen OMA87